MEVQAKFTDTLIQRCQDLVKLVFCIAVVLLLIAELTK